MTAEQWETYFALLIAIAAFTLLIGEIAFTGGFRTHTVGSYFTNNTCSSFLKSSGNTSYSETVCSP